MTLEHSITVEREIHGKTLSFGTQTLAKQASGSVFVTMGQVQSLATTALNTQKSDKNFLPLSVDYVEKFYAAGRVPGSYGRREGKPSDHEVLVSRMIDRPIRPLFPKGFRNEVQIIATVMSMDLINPSDVISMNAAFASLYLSTAPVDIPLGAVRVAADGDELIINPTYSELEKSSLDLIVAGTAAAVTMIEGSAKEVSEDFMLKAIEQAHKAIKEITELIAELGEKTERHHQEFELFAHDEALVKTLRENYFKALRPLLEIKDKLARDEGFNQLLGEAKAKELANHEDVIHQTADILTNFQSEILRKMILEEDSRSDGRKMDKLRPISCDSHVLAKVHGSSVFTRGETQALAVVALGSTKDKQRVDLVTGSVQKGFILHYNFPPYSVGEVGRAGFTGRREIGHGMLAERSLQAVLPPTEEFDYTIRLVSEILESNGSSSMATVCAGSMALMDAGVPIRKHVAGISMGLVLDETSGQFKILTDIQGLEDHLGDMDFKVAGTGDGITGFQLDIKVQGITVEIMREALAAARAARLEILEKMTQAIEEPGALSSSAPKREVITIKSDKIKLLVGVGGKTIRKIVEETKSEIDIEDDGTVKIFALNEESLAQTKLLIETSVGMPKIGTVYQGKIKRIFPFGVFVEIIPGVDGLCHISNLSHKRIENINASFSEGQMLVVKVSSIDENGRIALTCKNIRDDENPAL